ncbi:MAG: HAD-IA family hydrolase, partial [SAR324 cluster bacterium]|nr:HAD-IA family hydrolase [SAR324 cluster bacterium]
SRVYREVSDGIAHGGIEYYLPLFFETTANLTDYLPENCVVLAPQGLESVLSGAWDEVERGEMTLDTFAEILSGFLARQGIQIDMERARNFMGNPADSIMMRLRPEIVEACLTVRRVMPTALLTNNIAEWREQWRTRLDIPALFNQVIDSSEVGLRKPEPGIYKLMEAALNMPGEDLLFIDDLGVNLKGARNLGWQTLKYDETAKVLEVLSTVTSAAQG